MRELQFRLRAMYADGRTEDHLGFYTTDPTGMRKVIKNLNERTYEEWEDPVIGAWVEQRTVVTTDWERIE